VLLPEPEGPISAEIPAHRVTALIGPSGSGKSTLADLACGLLEPDDGQILIDGTPLDAQARRAWRGRVAYVQQDPVIFFGTMRQNLACANRSADDDAMWRALDAASATFARSLPQGLDTLLGEGARRLSGGERQRLMLARALMREPDLLVLDEATSALDAENDAAIAEAIAALKGRLTIIIICHRGAMLALADKTITLQGGRLDAKRNADA
jgi:ATP-binding cassette subfamily C protein